MLDGATFMNRWLLSKLGTELLAQVGLALVIVSLIAEALLIIDGLAIGLLSDRTDKVLTSFFTAAIALGVWWEYIGHKAKERPRQLTNEQKEALARLLESDLFQKGPKPALRVGSVNDAEAQMYAMNFQRLFESCEVNIYPTDGGLPNEVAQVEPHPDGLVLRVKTMSKPNPAFVAFQHLVHSLGIAIPVQEAREFGDNEAMLTILRKPD